MLRWFIFIVLLLLCSQVAEAQFGDRKFGIGNFGNFKFGIQKFEEVAVTPPAGGDALLLESGDYLLLETGDNILLE